MNLNQEMENFFLLYNGPNNEIRPPRILGLTRKFVLYYHNLVTGQLTILRLKRRDPHPSRNASLLLTKYKSTLRRYQNSIEKTTNPQRYHMKIEYYNLVIKLLKRALKKTNYCIA